MAGPADRIRKAFARLKQILTPEGTLMERAITGGIWATALNVSGRVFQLLTAILLARLLSPRAFGIVAIGMLVIIGLERFSKLGLDDALIYNRDSNVDRYLDTAWVMNAGRGITLAAILFFSAPYVGSFYDEALVVEILPVMAIGPLILGLRNPAILYFRKDLVFHKEFVYDVSGEAAYFFAALAYALWNPSPWALVVGYLSRNTIRTILSYVLHGYRPWPRFDVELAREMFDYGKWITGGSIMNYIRNEGDDHFVGWLLSASSLGFYQMAYRLSNAPATEVTHVIASVSFPAYSEVQDDVEKLRTAFYKTVRISAFLAAPMAVGIAMVAPTFVEAVLGEQWLPMVVPMQVLAAYGMIRGFVSSYGSVWRATGHPDYLVKLQLLSIVLMAIPLYPATVAYGLTGTALVITCVYAFIMFPIDTYLAASAAEADFKRLVLEFAYPLPAAILMGAAVFWTRNVVQSLPPLAELVVLVVVGMATYAAAVVALDSRINWNILREIKNIRDML
ncbi:lipopolysaccharide biosynthesis protein [Halogeometricum limi]|uniref:Polysaccharide transporter, PST family n=1 Tax=Halogeometricum limi TaxID=555875 RepID=A0A1I6IKL0_9EURY|nr:lipopolysaccharide biosynthesis protein [Halogeometricum limi]SFR67204.1 polysaccharide transporter, PST family [Halogeometricum limi]